LISSRGTIHLEYREEKERKSVNEDEQMSLIHTLVYISIVGVEEKKCSRAYEIERRDIKKYS